MEFRRGQVTVRLQRLGADLLVTITGGDRPHGGAVAVSLPRPSLKGDGTTGASTSVLCVPGHKEDLLAREAGERLTRATGMVAVVVAGIHLEGATGAEIERLQGNALEAVDDLIKKLQKK